MSAKPVLYFWDESPPARTVLFLVRYLNLDVEIHHVSLEEWNSEDFLKLNPAKKIPVLVDGDLVLSESTAICQYLYEKNGSDKPVFGSGLVDRARVTSMQSYNTATLFQKLYNIVHPLYARESTTIPEALKKKVLHEFGVLDKLLGKHKFAATEYPTVADFGLLATLASLHAINFDTSKYQNISTWLKNCETLPALEENTKGAKLFGDQVRGFAPESFQS